MRSGSPVIVIAGLFLGLGLATPAAGQPRPSDAEPLDYLPPVTTSAEPLPAPGYSAGSGTQIAPSELPVPLPPTSLSPSTLPPASNYRAPAARYRPPGPSVVPVSPGAAYTGSAYSYSNPADAPPEISPNANSSRYIMHDGRWWYFEPAGKWMYWSEGRWVEYIASRYAGSPPSIKPPPGTARRWRRTVSGSSAY